jgi:hypothetical protein
LSVQQQEGLVGESKKGPTELCQLTMITWLFTL